MKKALCTYTVCTVVNGESSIAVLRSRKNDGRKASSSPLPKQYSSGASKLEEASHHHWCKKCSQRHDVTNEERVGGVGGGVKDVNARNFPRSEALAATTSNGIQWWWTDVCRSSFEGLPSRCTCVDYGLTNKKEASMLKSPLDREIGTKGWRDDVLKRPRFPVCVGLVVTP